MPHRLATAVVAAALAVAASPIFAYTIDDAYVGSEDHGYGDVIGATSYFDVFGANTALSGNILSVEVFTNFAGYGDDGLYTKHTCPNPGPDCASQSGSGPGIGYGDLFLSTSWSPFGSAPYLYDDASNGTHWEYGLALDNRNSSTGGTVTLYSLAGAIASNDNPGVLISDDFVRNTTFRNGQEVAVDTGNASNTVVSNGSGAVTGTWTVNNGTSLLFTVDLAGTSLVNEALASGGFSLHWAMTCANDTLEGMDALATPEPSSMWLGLPGLVLLLARRLRKNTA